MAIRGVRRKGRKEMLRIVLLIVLFMMMALSVVTETVTRKTQGKSVNPMNEVGRGITRTLNNADKLAPDLTQALDKVDQKIAKIGKRSVETVAENSQANLDLSGQDFANLQAPKGVYASATLTGTNVIGALLDDAVFEGAAGDGAVFKKARMARTNLNAVKFADADFTETDLRGASLRASDLSSGIFTDADASGASFAASNLANVIFTSGYAQAGSFVDANAVNIDFTQTDLRAARFTRANLASADFTGADVTGADFTGAKLQGAKLGDAIGLTTDQLLSACGDETTTLPAGSAIYACE